MLEHVTNSGNIALLLIAFFTLRISTLVLWLGGVIGGVLLYAGYGYLRSPDMPEAHIWQGVLLTWACVAVGVAATAGIRGCVRRYREKSSGA